MTPNTSTLTARVDLSDASASALHRAAITSLPSRWRLVKGDGADAAVIAGDSETWPDQASARISAGVRGLIVTHPARTLPERLRSLAATAREAGASIAIDSAYMVGQAWASYLHNVQADVDQATLLDSVVTLPAVAGVDRRACLESALVEHLAVVASMLGPVERLDDASLSDLSYTAVGRCGGVTISLLGVISGAAEERLSIDLVGPSCRWHAALENCPSGAMARPAMFVRFDAGGSAELPALFESPRRRTWAELHDAVVAGRQLTYSLDRLIDAAESAAAIFTDSLA